MKLYRLETKTVLRFFPKASEFLKAYSSNVDTAPTNAFLDRMGKIVVTFYQKKVSINEIYVVIEKKFLNRLFLHLEKYLAFSDTKITGSNLEVYADVESDRDEIILSDKKIEEKATGGDYLNYRLLHNIPIQGIDYDQEMLLNIGNEKYVNYEKGCYLGQEIIARVHYKSKPPKKLVVKKEEDCSPEEKNRMTSKLKDPRSGKIMGFVMVENEL